MATIIYTGRYTGITFPKYGLSNLRRGTPHEVSDEVAKELTTKYPNDYKLEGATKKSEVPGVKKPTVEGEEKCLEADTKVTVLS